MKRHLFGANDADFGDRADEIIRARCRGIEQHDEVAVVACRELNRRILGGGSRGAEFVARERAPADGDRNRARTFELTLRQA